MNWFKTKRQNNDVFVWILIESLKLTKDFVWNLTFLKFTASLSMLNIPVEIHFKKHVSLC